MTDYTPTLGDIVRFDGWQHRVRGVDYTRRTVTINGSPVSWDQVEIVRATTSVVVDFADIEFVPATPEGIAAAIVENEAARNAEAGDG